MVALLAGCAPRLAGTSGPLTAPLAVGLEQLFDDPAFAEANWGVVVRSLDTGEALYSRNAEKLFVPASNVKLLTGAAALETLGPEYRYRTTIAAAGEVRDGALEGPLVVIGTGDPTFSGRFLDDPRDTFRAWADSLRAHGITRIAGTIVGVDTAFIDPPLGAGWMWDDLTTSPSAEFGALQFNDGVVELDIFPASTNLQPAVIVVDPPTQAVRIINDTRTMTAGSITALRVLRDENGRGIIIRGEVAADGDGSTRVVAVRDPALFLVSVLRETLRDAGIAVEGPAIRHTSLEPYDPALHNAVPIFSHLSPPLTEILAGMMKPSQNQIAETLLRTVGREVRGEGSADGGAAVVDSILRSWQIDNVRFRMVDGSGLSRYDLASPALLAQLLTRMDESVYREEWIASLPVAGRDGTLEDRMRAPPLLDRVHAKTGSLSGVRALSGYLTTQRGERIVFSTIVNNYLVPTADADRVVEAALELIATAR